MMKKLLALLLVGLGLFSGQVALAHESEGIDIHTHTEEIVDGDNVFILSEEYNPSYTSDNLTKEMFLDSVDFLKQMEIGPQYIPCDQGGKHNMKGSGTGDVYNTVQKKYTIRSGYAHRCSKCKTVIVSTENPSWYFVTRLGYYTTMGSSGAQQPYYHISTPYALSYNSKLGADDFTQGIVWADRVP